MRKAAMIPSICPLLWASVTSLQGKAEGGWNEIRCGSYGEWIRFDSMRV